MDCPSDFGDVLVGKHPLHPTDHGTHLAGIDEQDLSSPIPTTLGFVVGEEPKANGNLSVQTTAQVAPPSPPRRHEHPSRMPFTAGVGTHRSIGEHYACFTTRAKFPEHVL